MLYPSIEPYDSGMLKVSDLHTLYYEQSGNANGNPIVYVHGGPGGGSSADDRRYFDPESYRIVVFDQRGAGKSTPTAELVDNTTWSLVADLERLRLHLNIDKWVVFGGSWGSTLALTYAITHKERVKALILRGIFTLRKCEVDWFYQQGNLYISTSNTGASFIFPDYWEAYLAVIPEEERHDMVTAYYKRLTGTNDQEKLACAKAWSTWECATSKLFVDPSMIAKCDADEFVLAFSRIESHFFINKGFFESDSFLLDRINTIKDIPGVIVQGRYDVVCPAKTAYEVAKAWPGVQLVIVDDAGHSAKEKSTTLKLVEACEKFKHL